MNKLSLKSAIAWVVCSTLLISGSAIAGWLYLLRMKDDHIHSDQYRIVAIVQTTPDKEALKAVFLAELLGLSVDNPVNLYQFDTEEATQKLLNSIIIKEAIVKKVRPGTVYVDYVMRTPMAYFGDYRNAVVDSEGVLFPISPYFTPKKLPEIRLGIVKDEEYGKTDWGARYQEDRRFQLAKDILSVMEKSCRERAIYLKRIDVSKAFISSYGQREIVVVLEEGEEKEENGRFVTVMYTRFLRMNVDDYERGWVNYLALRNRLEDLKTVIIDFRISHLAFVKDIPQTF